MAEPLRIIEVDVERIGTPRNDGTPGSALYMVPVRLSRAPDNLEAKLLVDTWNSPPTFSTMHRRGILSVAGDRLILNGTTIDEVAEVHATTLKLIVEETNRRSAVMRDEMRRQADKTAAEVAEHREHVEDIAARVEF